MDFEYGEQAEAFRREVQAFLAENLDPDWRHEAGVGDEEIEDAGAAVGVENPFLAQWHRKLVDAGLVGIAGPEEYGGRGLTLLEQIVFAEEMFRAGAPQRLNFMGETLVGPTIIQWGTEEHKKRFLPPILEGAEQWCQGFSEPNAGSDLAGVSTKAVLDGNEWVITGQKVWTTVAQISDYCFCLCRTDPDASKHGGISYILVPMKQPGITVRPLTQISGAQEFNEVFFDEARAPVDNVVGGVNNGWKVAMTTLGFERGSSATTQHLRYEKEWRKFADLAKNTPWRDGRTKAEDPLVRLALARAYEHVLIMKAQGFRTVTAIMKGESPGPGASVNKIFWSEYHRWVTEVAMSIRGPEAWVVGPDYELDVMQAAYLFAKSETIWGGTAEIQRNIVGERILGLPKEPKPEKTTARTS